MSLTLEAFASWLYEYRRGWEARDAKPRDLYAGDGTHQVTPFLKPIRGHAAIFE